VPAGACGVVRVGLPGAGCFHIVADYKINILYSARSSLKGGIQIDTTNPRLCN